MFNHRYLITKDWAVRIDPECDSDRAAMAQPPDFPKTLVATRPLPTDRGLCVALRLLGREMRVCVVTPEGRRWLPVANVLTKAQAEAWSRVGFSQLYAPPVRARPKRARPRQRG